MGDMADYTTDAGLHEYAEHLAGRCGEHGPCPYCDEDRDDLCPACKGCGQCQECDGGTDDDGNVCGDCGGDGACVPCAGTGEEPDDAPA